MDEKEQMIAQWAEGQVARYNLYRGATVVEGTNMRTLVEAIADDSEPVVRSGDVITAELAARIRAQVSPESRGKITIPVLVVDSEGQAVMNGDEFVVETVEIDDIPEGQPLTISAPVLAHDDDMHCDMCGEWRESLKQIGAGWYCEVPRAKDEGTVTCVAVRIAQMQTATQLESQS